MYKPGFRTFFKEKNGIETVIFFIEFPNWGSGSHVTIEYFWHNSYWGGMPVVNVRGSKPKMFEFLAKMVKEVNGPLELIQYLRKKKFPFISINDEGKEWYSENDIEHGKYSVFSVTDTKKGGLLTKFSAKSIKAAKKEIEAEGYNAKYLKDFTFNKVGEFEPTCLKKMIKECGERIEGFIDYYMGF